MSPHTEPISIQRWSPRRLRLTIGAAALAIVAIAQIVREFQGSGLL